MSKLIKRGHLRLAYSAPEVADSDEFNESIFKTDSWNQLDLFSQLDTIYFLSPEKYPFLTLVDFLQTSHVSQIIDLRRVPHFVFDGISRKRFFETLGKFEIKYIGLKDMPNAYCEQESQGLDIIKQHLQTGPSVVFSDLEPIRDPDIKVVIKKLHEAEVKFTGIFASIS